ncbi:NADPH-dependent oxidoreductase [Paenimyroides tangerinum]|uniref:NADPH-dependent oxidoreductase n=1 Tax=Paenimyroides tangerinum TaxID=2488728 RepID=A0A3P3W7X4_9FLAO|nr:NAD(P)H-dependent oxidoreductase [Paenimyroides tangerinum]RRJ91271.1 NADPH-dependent oxidoreductase [Paenimyroides tangerinum]
MKTIAFVGSNSSKSINKQLALSLIKNKEVEFIDIQNWNVPMYSEDIQINEGFPEAIVSLASEISDASNIIIAVNEHNSNVSAFMKNILDWLSRHSKKIFAEKKILVLSTSNGQRGGLSANEFTVGFCSRNGAETVEGFTFPAFSENFDIENQVISNLEKKKQFETIISNFINK